MIRFVVRFAEYRRGLEITKYLSTDIAHKFTMDAVHSVRSDVVYTEHIELKIGIMLEKCILFFFLFW